MTQPASAAAQAVEVTLHPAQTLFFNHPTTMHTFRRLSRRSWLLHLYLMLSMVFWPMPQIGAYWTRDANGDKVSVTDPDSNDSWWNDDSDNDSLSNGDEVAFGSDPFNPDSDYDGLTDRDERDLTPVMLGYTASTDPWNWDSDGDGYSDHDEYWSYITSLPLNVSYSGRTFPSPLPATYFKDLDGDGTDNLSDYSPEDPNVSSPPPPADSDGDSVADGNDSHPNDSSRWNDWNNNGTNDDQETIIYDADGDGHQDSSDSHPYNSSLWNDWNNNGTNDDQETIIYDADGDGYQDSSDSNPYNSSLWEDWNGNGVNDSNETPPADTDGDGYPDDQDSHSTDNSRWDDWNNNGISDSSEPSDVDGDGVIDDEEYLNGTNPWFHDSDGDGISDGEERTATTNPLQVDTDSDGLTDHEEIMIYGTNPLMARTNAGQPQLDYYHVNHADSDADGIPNVIESWYGRDPASNLDAQSDLDGDGFTDLQAYQAGWHFTVVFTIYDADRDGITDAREAYWGLSTTDPTDATDDHDNDGVLTIEELRLGLNPLSASTHEMPDLEYVNATWNLGWLPCVNRGSSATSLDNDTDGDGMPDYWEHKHRLDWRKASDAIRDPDRDGLSNLTEFRFKSHPRIPKTTNNTHDRSRLYATGSPVNASTAGGLMGRYRAQIATELGGTPAFRSFNVHDIVYPSGGGGGGDEPPCGCSLVACNWCDGDGLKDCTRCGGDTWIPCDGTHTVECENQSTCTKHGSKRCGSHHAVECDGSNHGTIPSRVFDCHDHVAACYGPNCGLTEHIHEGLCDPEETGAWQCGVMPHTHSATCGETLNCSFKDHEHSDDETSACYKDGEPRPTTHAEEGCQNIMHVQCTNDSCVPNPCPGYIDKPCTYPPEDRDQCPEGETCSICCDGQVPCDPCGRDGKTDQNACGLPDCTCEGVPASECPHATEPIPDPETKTIPPASVNASDGAGSRYRKIGLNGLPLTDAKPQQQDESGELPEETYIDAYSGLLRHSVSDIYVKAEGSELPLMVRRDVAGDVSSAQHGLKLIEKPNLPFGPGWSSNICAYIKVDSTTSIDPEELDYNRVTATVTDEMGSTQGFVPAMTPNPHTLKMVVVPGEWAPDGASNSDAKSRQNKLIPTSSGFILQKKFGSICFYESAGITQEVSADRMNGSNKSTLSTYYRLREVRDRMGNRLVYDYYAGGGTLIPYRISDPDRPGHQIQIFQTNGVVERIKGPDGQETRYTYQGGESQPVWPFHLLSVQRGASTVQYEYETSPESYIYPVIMPSPEEPDNDVHLPYVHTNVSAIIDERGKEYRFTRSFDHSTKHRVITQDNYTLSVQQGASRVIQSVYSPNGAVASVYYQKEILTQTGALGISVDFPGASVSIQAVDGSLTHYGYYSPHVEEHSHQYNKLGVLSALSFVGTYTNMLVKRYDPSSSVLTTGATPLSSESYTLNPEASMAVASATDLSGNTTTFTYGTDGYDDPLTETTYLQNANGTTTPVTKTFTYDAATRIMTSMTDPTGVTTEYLIETKDILLDSDGDGSGDLPFTVQGLKTAEIVSKNSTTLREIRYDYDHPTFAGLMTKQRTISPNEAVMPSSVTLTSLGQAIDSLGANPGWWREVTTTTGPATNSGELDTSAAAAFSLSSTLTISDFGGKKRSVIDPRGFIANFDYDASGRLTRVYHPDGSAKSLGYDAHGNLTSESEGTFNGTTLQSAVFTPIRTTFHKYDALNRRIKSATDLNGDGQPNWDTTSTTEYGPGDQSYTAAGSSPPTFTSPPTYDGDLVTTTVYNNRNQVTVQTDSRGSHSSNEYDSAGRLSATVKNGLRTEFFYDGINNGGSIFDSSAIKPNRTIDPRGVVTTVLYDSLYRVVSSTVSDPGLGGGPIFTAVTSTEFDLNGRPVKVTDPLGRVTLNEYDDFGNVIKVTEPDLTTNTADNPIVQSFYTHHGKPWKVIDQNGTETITTYDALGRAVSVQGPVLDAQGTRAVTTNEYDAAGNVIRVTDPLGRVTETLYDARNRPWKVFAPTVWDAEISEYVRPTSETTYDALGQVIEVKDPTGAVTTTHYDRAGRKWRVQAPSPISVDPLAPRPTTITSFDPGGLPLTVTNPLGQTITNAYNIHGQLVRTDDAEGIVNTFAYDEAGNRTSVKDGKNQTTTFAYDGLNRLVSQTFANGDTWTHSYNAIQKLSQTSPRGIVTSYTYDARDRLLTVNAPAHAASGTPALYREYGYDNAGRLRTVAEGSSPSALSSTLGVSYTYDAMGRVTAESSHGRTHFYEYDLAGNRVRAEYSTGRVVETSYDGLNRPEAIAEGPRLTRYGYDLAGRALLLVSPNGQTSMNSYDRLGRLVDRTLFKTPAMNESDVLAEFSWEHDLLGNVLAQHETWPGAATRQTGIRSTVMAYDDNNRLIEETIQTRANGNAAPQDQSSTSYVYDAANNRRSKTVTRIAASSPEAGENDVGHWEFSYNTANQLTSWEKWDEPSGTLQKTATLSYDESGNRTSQVISQIGVAATSGTNPPATAAGTTLYAWDAQDRLRSVTMANGSVHSYAYDYRTRRIGTSELQAPSSTPQAAKHTAITFSGGLSVAEWEQESGTGLQPVLTTPPTVEYTRGPDMGGGVGGLLYSKRGSTLKYNLSNGRGDIVAQADSNAALTWTASYEAYGKRTKETGTNEDKQRANSKDEDPTGLLNEGFRYRDIETGVWLSRDPAGFVDGPNLYAYVKQNPWSGFDPDGLAEKKAKQEPKSDKDLTPEQRKQFMDTVRSKLWDLYKNHDHQVGDQYPGDKGGRETTWCHKYPVECVAAGYEAIGLVQTAKQIRENAEKEGRGITDVAKILQDRGWAVTFYNADTSKPGSDNSHRDSTNGVNRNGKYLGPLKRDEKGNYVRNAQGKRVNATMSVDGSITDFSPGKEGWEGANEELKKVDFAVVVGSLGRHGLAMMNGAVYHVHRGQSDPSALYTKEDFNTAHGIWQSGLLITPPGSHAPRNPQ
jgi:RHS repeat-associated protein